MECLEQISSAVECSVCGDRMSPDKTWFVITENVWEDRLKIWKWDSQLAREGAARSVCGQRHARELVVHWMTTGCLHYPFAAVPLRSPRQISRPASLPYVNATNGSPKAQLGEIAVDRPAIARVLRDNPLWLNPVLDELMMALENEALDDAEADRDDKAYLAPRTV